MYFDYETFLEDEKDLINNQKEQIFNDEENEIDAQQDILDTRRKNLKAQQAEIKEDEETYYPEYDDDDSLLIEDDMEDEEFNDNGNIDMGKLEEGLRMIIEEAESLGLFDEDCEECPENYYDPSNIQEAKKPYTGKRTVIKLGRKARYNWFKSRSAIAYARAYDDPMFKKLAIANKNRKEMLRGIKQKYDSKASKRAKELMNRK